MITILREDGSAQELTAAEAARFTFQDARAKIGCSTIERLPVVGAVLLFDEDGRLKRRARNPEASRLAGVQIVGVAIKLTGTHADLDRMPWRK